jgi:hypothetical protein
VQLGCERWRPRPKVQLAVILSVASLGPLSTAGIHLEIATVNEDGVPPPLVISFVNQFTIGGTFSDLLLLHARNTVAVSGEGSVLVFTKPSYSTLVPRSGTHGPDLGLRRIGSWWY